MRKLTIIGASGHGKVVADIARLNGYDGISFLDDNIDVKKCGKYDVIGTTELIEQIDGDFIVGIGNASVRKDMMERLCESNKKIVSLIHPNSVIAEDVVIGNGTVVMAGAVINPGTKIGDGAIINTCSSVDHDCVIGDYVHIAVGAHVCGTVSVGDFTWIGAGATIINNLIICNECMIGAGAVVIDDLKEKGTYIGVPVRKYENTNTCQ